MVQLLVVMNEKFWESTPPCLASVDRLARVEGLFQLGVGAPEAPVVCIERCELMHFGAGRVKGRDGFWPCWGGVGLDRMGFQLDQRVMNAARP